MVAFIEYLISFKEIFLSLDLAIQIDICFANGLIYYYLFKKYGKILLKRFALILSFNIQIFFWSDFTMCKNIVTNQIKSSTNETPWELYVLVGASAIFLAYCTYLALTSFHQNTYIPYMYKRKNEILSSEYRRLLEKEQKDFTEAEAIRFQMFNKLNGTSEKLMADEIAKVQNSLFQKNINNVDIEERFTKFLNDRISFYNYGKLDQTSGDTSFHLNMTQKERSILAYPDYFLYDYNQKILNIHKEFVNNIETATNCQNLTAADIQVYYNYLNKLTDKLFVLDQIVSGPGGKTHQSFFEIHQAFDEAMHYFDTLKLGFHEPVMTIGGLSLMSVYCKKSKTTTEFIDLHTKAVTIDSIHEKYAKAVYIPNTFMAPERVERAIAADEIIIPTAYDITLVFGYGFLSISHMFFGTPNPITWDVCVNSYKNLYKRFILRLK